jgi:hypothetical protein
MEVANGDKGDRLHACVQAICLSKLYEKDDHISTL